MFIWQKTSNGCQYNRTLTADLADWSGRRHACGDPLITCLLGGASHLQPRPITGAVLRYLDCQPTSLSLMSAARRSKRLWASRVPLKGALFPPCTGDSAALCSDSEDTHKHVLSIAVSQKCSAGAIFYFYNIYYQNERGVCFYRFNAELEQQSGWELRTIFFQTSLKYDLSFKYFDPLIRQLKTKTTPNALNPANLESWSWSFLQSFPFVHEKVHLLMNTCPSVKNHAENCTMSKQLNQWWISVSVGVIHKVCVYVCVHVRVCVSCL